MQKKCLSCFSMQLVHHISEYLNIISSTAKYSERRLSLKHPQRNQNKCKILCWMSTQMTFRSSAPAWCISNIDFDRTQTELSCWLSDGNFTSLIATNTGSCAVMRAQLFIKLRIVLRASGSISNLLFSSSRRLFNKRGKKKAFQQKKKTSKIYCALNV